MTYRETTDQLNTLRGRIAEIRTEMRNLQREAEPEVVTDHALESGAGPVRLSQLFGKHRDLMIIHNMGRSCAYCTMWADGYNGLYDHIADRAAFVLVSPDAPDVQQRFAQSRGWRFPMLSDPASGFAGAMGYVGTNGRPQPGISVFQQQAGRIVRVSDVAKGPYDDFCSAWHLFDLLPQGADGWSPKFGYGKAAVAAA